PLEVELAHWVAADQVAVAAARYRVLYAEIGAARCVALPGAAEAVRAVRAAGGRAVVVTAKYGPNAARCLTHAGIDVDEIIGDRWGAAKGEALAAEGADVYVGDHVSDVAGARIAGAHSVAVATGPCSAAELRAAGADTVIESLTDLTGWLSEHLLDRRLGALEERLRELGSVLVAFSGGADSAFLLAAAARTLGPDGVVAATAVSPSLPAAELAGARDFAASLGVRHLTPATRELDRADYRANPRNRCYFCKAELTEVLGPLAPELGLAHIVTGTNADDLVAGFRPGIRAAAERGAATPLAAAGLTKAQVRAASRRWGLVTWDKPAAACLSSRVAYGIPITTERLARVENAESTMRAALVAAGLPTRDLRIRDLGTLSLGTGHHGDVARVEVDAELVDRLAARPDLWATLPGFDRVELDPRGFRSGSMNDLLSAE
ncbi:MAG: ATP-dependent sacrificial sulfur transferase LarE, partial [Frankia sp.]